MLIRIKEKFKIISHDLGTSFLILNTSYFVKIYPGILSFKDLSSNNTFKVFLKFQGSVKNFTILQNLFNGNIEVNFHTKKGFLAYKIFVKEKNVYLYFDRITDQDLKIEFNNLINVSLKQKILLPIKLISITIPEELLFLGIYKKSDLYFIRKRENLNEILPFIFLYSQFYLEARYSCCLKKKCLLKEINKCIQKKEKQNLNETFLNAFKVHFFSAFIPRMNDEEYQNIVDIDEKGLNPFCVFNNFYHSIKSMLIEFSDNQLFILPCLLKEFHHGRAVNIKTSIGSIDIEWSKKLLKKAIFRPLRNDRLKLVLQSDIKTFRIRTSKNEKGKIFKNLDNIAFQKNKIYLLDKFKK